MPHTPSRLSICLAAFLSALAATSAESSCGDGVTGELEPCDDGNSLDGDCCSSSCNFEDSGSPCPDDGNPATFESCDGEGTCLHWEQSTTTTSSSTTSSSMPEDYDMFVVVGAYPAKPLKRIDIEVYIDEGYGYDAAESGSCKLVSGVGTMSYRGEGIFRIDFSQVPGGYRQSQALLGCFAFAHWYNGSADLDFNVHSAKATDDTTQTYDVDLCYTQYDYHNYAGTLDTHLLCGDADLDEDTDAADALVTLRAAVGGPGCSGDCDVDGNHKITAADTLRILKFAVGQDLPLLCGC